MKKKMSLWRGIIFGLALIIAPAVLFSSCWEDLDDVLGMRETKLIIKRVLPGDNIKEAIEKAMDEGADVVQVAKGTYVSSDQIIVNKDIKIYGGYSEDFSSRDPLLNITEIKVTLLGKNNSSALWFYPGTTKESVLDGFTVTADISNANDSSAIVLYGSSIISNCVITGPVSGTDCHAVQLAPSSNGAIVMNNEIIVRSLNDVDHGIFDLSTNVFIVNNIIRSTGIFARRLVSPRGGSGAMIYNNILVGNNSTAFVHAVYIQSGDNAEIKNNIFFKQSGSQYFYCVYELTTDDDPKSFLNNTIAGEIRYRNEGPDLITIAAINSMLDIETGDNISVDMMSPPSSFVDYSNYNYHLSDDCPSSVSAGGLNLTAEFKARGIPAKDKDGNPRPSSGPWAIGPYEKVN